MTGTSRSTIVHSARLVHDLRIVDEAWVRIEDGTVRATGSGDGWRNEAPDAAVVVDASGLTLTPGFVDIHCHGGGGFSYEDGPDAISGGLDFHLVHGTTRSLISLVSAPLPALIDRLTGASAAVERDPRALGFHLEGPFLSEEFRGAHDPAALAAPDAASLRILRDAAAGLLRVVTLAPERAGALSAIATLRADGVTVAVGHTGADADIAAAAFAAGAGILTHAFNGMRGIHHRAPGPVVAALAAPGVTLEVILDGVHVDPRVVRMVMDAAPARVALVTDAMAAAGATEGSYLLGSLAVTVVGGVARTAAGGLAGSTLTQDRALRAAIAAGAALPAAVAAVTAVPAGAVGRSDLGHLRVGAVGDAVLLDDLLRVRTVFLAGDEVHTAPPAG